MKWNKEAVILVDKANPRLAEIFLDYLIPLYNKSSLIQMIVTDK